MLSESLIEIDPISSQIDSSFDKFRNSLKTLWSFSACALYKAFSLFGSNIPTTSGVVINSAPSDFALQIRELTGRKPEGQVVTNKKIGRIQILVYKERNGFVAYIDGDRLDVYKTKAEAEKAAMAMIKVLKK